MGSWDGNSSSLAIDRPQSIKTTSQTDVTFNYEREATDSHKPRKTAVS